MPEPNYVQRVAARRAALPISPILDFVDYMLAVCGIDRAKLQELSKQETFLACIARYRSTTAAPLGYLALYFLKHRAEALPALDDDAAIDCIRIAAYCQDLPATDLRHVPKGKSLTDWAALHPDLFPNASIEIPGRALYREAAIREMTGFAEDHPLREGSLSFTRLADQDDYLDYWMARSEDQIGPYLADERFCAGLEAMGNELLSFHGLLRKVYGRDYYERVLAPRHYVLFEGLDPRLSSLVVRNLANDVASGRRPVPPNLKGKYPEIYVVYMPENYGDDYL